MATLSLIKRPEKGDEVCELWRVVDRCVVFVNAMLKCTVSAEDGAGRLQVTEGNAVLTVPAGGGEGATGGGYALNPYALDDTHVGFTYGTICGQQPASFVYGATPAFSLTVSGSGLLYAKATGNASTLQWSSPEVIQATGTQSNTSTVAYEVIGSYATDDDGVLSVTSALAGNVKFSFAQLAPP